MGNELSDRKKRILSAVINDYIETAEPVGSKTISQKEGLGLSSATIRNEMAELTSMGYLEQPHTSAGRIPSPLGYRLFVNELMHWHKLTVQETQRINKELSARVLQLDRMVSDIVTLASQLTSYPALSLTPQLKLNISRFDLIHIDEHSFIIVAMLSNKAVKNKLITLPVKIEAAMITRLSALFNAHFTGISEELISIDKISAVERASGDDLGISATIASFAIEALSGAGAAEAHVAGTSTLLQQPEFRDPDKAHRLLSLLSDNERILSLVPASSDEDSDSDVKVMIGPENIAEELRDSSVIMASYNVSEDTKCMVGIVGPTRIDYARIAAQLKYFARGVSKIFRGEVSTGMSPAALGAAEMDAKGDDVDNES